MRPFLAACGIALAVAGMGLAVTPYRASAPVDYSPANLMAWAGGGASEASDLDAGDIPLPRARAVLRIVLVAHAARFVGAGPRDLGLHRVTLWCATAVNKFLADIGLKGTGSDWAKDFENWGRPTRPKPGAIAVGHRACGKPDRCGHVAIVERVHGTTVTVISPNGGGNKVRRRTHDVSRFYAYREPVT